MSQQRSSVRIAGAVALVTGANRGIGRALVDALLARGAAKVYATARRRESLDDLAAGTPDRIVALELDVTRPDQVRAAAAAAPDVQILVNNAGVVAKVEGELTDPAWIAAAREETEVNVLGLLSVTQAFAPALVRQGGSAVVNLGSVAGLVNLPFLASYSASKAAVHSLTQATRARLRPLGVHVAGVYPGPIDTDMARVLTVDKTPASVAANAILDGLEAGDDEIFPDPFARQIGELFLKSPKALEDQQYAEAGTVAER
jgi:NAD(P)-dependent dehydrogenase (short-subunit alcohol dehydrogenase family)